MAPCWSVRPLYRDSTSSLERQILSPRHLPFSSSIYIAKAILQAELSPALCEQWAVSAEPRLTKPNVLERIYEDSCSDVIDERRGRATTGAFEKLERKFWCDRYLTSFYLRIIAALWVLRPPFTIQTSELLPDSAHDACALVTIRPTLLCPFVCLNGSNHYIFERFSAFRV